MRKRYKKVNAWIAISSYHEGSNIYMPGGGFDIYESKEQALIAGWEEQELVKCKITYTAEEIL
jgi:hypothetical protein